MGHLGRAAKLSILAITGQGVAYLLSIVLARRLEIEGFEAYVVASAAFTMMIMFAPRGIDKYSLRLLPALLERGDWAPSAPHSTETPSSCQRSSHRGEQLQLRRPQGGTCNKGQESWRVLRFEPGFPRWITISPTLDADSDIRINILR